MEKWKHLIAKYSNVMLAFLVVVASEAITRCYFVWHYAEPMPNCMQKMTEEEQ